MSELSFSNSFIPRFPKSNIKSRRANPHLDYLSDLPSHILSEFSIHGDLDNERTEIDSELAFGFLKMGTILVPILIYLLFC